MAVTYIQDDDTQTVEIGVAGKVTRADFDQIAPKMQAFIEKHGSIKLLEVITDFTGFDPSVIWKGIAFDIKYIRRISHCAVVSDIGWLSPIAKAAGGVISTKLRTFDPDQIEAARKWLADADKNT